MAMKLLTARERDTDFLFRVHLDDTKVDNEGKPDPAYIVEYIWGKEPPEGQTEDEYLVNINREVTLLAADELAKRQVAEGTPLAGEGQAL